MRKPIYTLVSLLAALLVTQTPTLASDLAWLDQYDVEWTTQSENSNGTMPCSGGDIGMNVWVEGDDILLYVERSGNIDENDQLLKTGRFRIKMSPNPFDNDGENVKFTQRLDLRSGAIFIKGTTAENSAQFKIWSEVKRPVIHIEAESSTNSKVSATYESWRTTTQLIPQSEGTDYNRWACYGYCTYAGDVFSYADKIGFDKSLNKAESGVLFYHQNCDDLLFDKEVATQKLTNVLDQMRNPTKDRIFGGYLRGEGMKPAGRTSGVYTSTPFKGWKIESTKPRTQHTIEIALHTEQTPKIDTWRENLKARMDQDITLERAWESNMQWWGDFWARSYIRINSDRGADDIGWQVGRNYQLMRYILASNYYGEFPTRFNGGLFIVDAYYNDGLTDKSPVFYNADYRKWGAWTGMNQRLVHWPMLKSGDFEAMRPQFNFYRDNYINGYLRNKESFGIEAPSYAEQCNSGGLPNGYHYGWEAPYGKRNPKIEKGMEQSMHRTYYQTQLEFTFMMYEWYRFSERDLTEYMPFMKGTMNFFFEYFNMLQRRRTGSDWDENGLVALKYMNSTETYKPGSNPLPELAALNVNIKSLLALPEKWIDEEYKEKLRDWQGRVPDYNYREREGHKTYSPLLEEEPSNRLGNRELPQLYPVFPYGVCALGLDNVEIGRNTWKYGLDSVHNNYLSAQYGEGSYPQRDCWWGWGQQAAMLARLGMTDEAKYYISKKLADADGAPLSNKPFASRFPAFWGEGYGCKPSIEWGSVGMVGLQEMLLQTISNDGKDLRIYPAWPEDWDVEFKLHAPNKTTVESSFKGGKMESVNVLPAKRSKDIVYNK